MRIYKARKVDQATAARILKEAYQHTLPEDWSDFQFKQIEHIVKWASVNAIKREAVKLSKSLIVKELGHRGYVKHIHSIFPVEQGHNLGAGKISTYDYRGVLKRIVRWVSELGETATEQFKLVFNAIMAEIERTHKKRMGWFYMMVKSWFQTYAQQLRDLVKAKKEAVTTIHESSILYSCKSEFELSGKTGSTQTSPVQASSSAVQTFVELFPHIVSSLLCQKELRLQSSNVIL